MVRRTAALLLLITLAGGVPARAGESNEVDAAIVRASVVPAPARTAIRQLAPAERPLTLPALYVSLGALQAYDVYSTLTALNHGAAEANPLMQGIVGRPVAFVAIKAGVTTASIVAAERLWRSKKRVSAVLLMVAANGAMAYVAHNNARVLAAVR
jgi:hypothetical protein